ncbi:luciferase domain-containing protein [Actinoallomurus soli]|uniref:luciferase domain-containing protein n=1 Tax=Actinoallomurus soli TaxID=2952535 RepID=UPI003873650D
MRKAAARDPGAVTGPPKNRSTAERVAAQLATWPGLATGRPSCGAGRGFAYRGTQILHLHTGDEADLRLTRSFIERLDQVLAESGQIVVRPGDDWVTVRLDTDTAGSLLISLMSLAIQAAGDQASPTRPCTWERTRRSERSGRSRDETAREASEEGERPVETERTRRSERSGRSRDETAREASEEGERPVETERTRRSERSGRPRDETAREASEEGERPAETERTRRSERSGRSSSTPSRASGTTETAREASEEGERPADTERDRHGERSGRSGDVSGPDSPRAARSENGEGTLAARASERSLPRPLRRMRPLRQR